MQCVTAFVKWLTWYLNTFSQEWYTQLKECMLNGLRIQSLADFKTQLLKNDD